MSAMGSFLNGLLVVEFGGYIAGPTVGRTLAAMGADVIKVERPGSGDEGRLFGPMFEGEGLFFTDSNHGVRSITLDLANSAGLEVARLLTARADIVLENMRPRAMVELGLGPEALMATNDRLIYASISGFGADSSRAAEPAYDPIIQAATGIMFQQSASDEEPPVKAGIPIIDKAAALWCSVQILGAVIGRERTGQGAKLEVSLMSVGVSLMGLEILRYFHTGRDRFDPAPRDPGTGTYQAFECSDGRWVQIGLGNQRQFERVCEAGGRPELLDDPRLNSAVARGTHRQHEQRTLASVFRKKPRNDWLEILAARQVPATAVNHISEFLADAELSSRYVSSARLSSGESVPMLLSPLDPVPAAHESPAKLPRLGADTAWVLSELLGMDETTRHGLALRGAFGG